MSCFIDEQLFENPDDDAKYKRMCLVILPDIKKSRYCESCLSTFPDEVTPADCPLSQEFWANNPSPFFFTNIRAK